MYRTDRFCRVPFSVFPSSYRNQESSETTEVKTDERITVQGAGREDRRERYNSQAGPSRRDDRTYREDVRITEEDRYRRGGRRAEDIREDIRIREDDRFTGVGRHQDQDRVDTRVEVDVDRQR